jgi:hypothetical protein
MDSVGLLTRFFTTEWCNMFLLLENQALGDTYAVFYVCKCVTEGHKARSS